jgi:hypothetical protein
MTLSLNFTFSTLFQLLLLSLFPLSISPDLPSLSLSPDLPPLSLSPDLPKLPLFPLSLSLLPSLTAELLTGLLSLCLFPWSL